MSKYLGRKVLLLTNGLSWAFRRGALAGWFFLCLIAGIAGIWRIRDYQRGSTPGEMSLKASLEWMRLGYEARGVSFERVVEVIGSPEKLEERKVVGVAGTAGQGWHWVATYSDGSLYLDSDKRVAHVK